VKYNPRFNEFWGLTDGEGLKRFWSQHDFIGLMQFILVWMTLRNILKLHQPSGWSRNLTWPKNPYIRLQKLSNCYILPTIQPLQQSIILKPSLRSNGLLKGISMQTQENQCIALGELPYLQDELDEAW
jgi:hypothetical protein